MDSAAARGAEDGTRAAAFRRVALSYLAEGNKAVEAGDIARAIELFRQAYTTDPGSPLMVYARGVEALMSHRFDEAVSYLRRACSGHYRESAQAHYQKGCAYRAVGDYTAASRAFRIALTLDPAHVASLIGRGFALQLYGDRAQAMACFERALALPGRTPTDLHEQAVLAAWMGDYSRWPQYENRWRTGLVAHTPSLQNLLAVQRWNGAQFRGTLLLWAEQGLGDTLLMARYFALARERCTHLVLLVQPPLVTLFQHAGFDARPEDGTLPLFEAHAPMMSLPWLMGTDALEKVPPPVDLNIPRAGSHDDEPCRAALVWAAGQVTGLGADRSTPRRAFQPLLDLPNVEWYAFQHGHRADEYPELPVRGQGDFLATARELATMDLLVTVDTALAHLAGALGVMTFLFPATHFIWYWTGDFTGSTWYPTTHRLFRRANSRAWAEAIAELRDGMACPV